MRRGCIPKAWLGTALLSALILVFSNYSLAQDTKIEGVVLDRDGQPLKDVKIVFVSIETGQKLTAKSNKEGKFMRAGLPPGRYKVRAELDGYLPLETDFEQKFESQDRLKLTMERVPPKINEDPDLIEGTRLFQERKYQEALPFFQKGVEKFPASFEANYDLGLAYLRAGLFDEAISRFKKLQELKPGQAEVYLALGESYFMKGQNDEALAFFSKALELQPENAGIYYSIGIIYYKNDRVDEAIQNFTVAKSIDPQLAAAYYQLGLAFIKKGDMKSAAENLEKYLSLDPDSPQSAQVRTLLESLKKEK